MSSSSLSASIVSAPFPMAGELAALSAALIWSVSMTLVTRFGAGVSPQGLNLFKNLVAVFCLVLTLLALQTPWPVHTDALGMLILSGVIGIAVGDTALYGALKHLGAQVTSASQCLAPPIAALVAYLFCDEVLSRFEVLGMAVTSLAVASLILLMRRGGAHLADLDRRTLVLGIGLALLSAVCQGVGMVMARVAFQEVDLIYGVLARILPAMLILGVWPSLAAFARHRTSESNTGWRRPWRIEGIASRQIFFMLFLASFGGTFLGIILMSLGTKYAKAGVATALCSTYPVWIIPLARFILNERIPWQSVVATVVAVIGVVLMLL